MVDERTVVVLAQLPREQRHALMAEAAAAGYELNQVDSLGAAVLALATHPPAAVLVDLDLEEAEELCQKVRTKRRTVDIAIFGLAREVTNDTFARALRRGVDDVSSLFAVGTLAKRLAALPASMSIPPTARGDAVVATHDETEFVIGRLLTYAGYDVEYARDPITLKQLASLERMRLVVTSESMGSVDEFIEPARRRGGAATWIVVADPEVVPSLERRLAKTPRVGIVSSADPFEHILFVSNELAATASDARRERRVLHGALVRFRSTPDGPAELGYSYNVSPRGLYVRTLAPPEPSEIHIEVQAPNSDALVRLQGRVIWRRGFAHLGTTTAPPGFGMEITGGSENDRTTWARGCTQLLVARRAPPKRNPPSQDGVRSDASADGVDDEESQKPRLSEIEELDSSLLDSILPNSIRMIEQARDNRDVQSPASPTASAVAAPQAPRLPRIGEGESSPDGAAPAASPEPEPRSRPKPAPHAEPEPSPASKQKPFREPPPEKELPPSATPGKPQRPDDGGTRASPATAVTARKRRSKASPRKKAGLSIAVGLTIGCILALLSVLGWRLMVSNKSIARSSPTRGAVSAPALDNVTSKGSSPPSIAAGESSAPAPAGRFDDAGPTGEHADADARADAESIETPEDATDVEATRVRDEPVNQEPTNEVSDVPEGELLYHEAYLVVESSIDARVYSNGIDVGPTNAKNKVRCGLRNVRLGDEPGKWRTDGYTVQIDCVKLNRIRLEPTR